MHPLLLVAVVFGGVLLLRAMGKRSSPPVTVTPTPAASEAGSSIIEQSSGQNQLLGSALATGSKYGLVGALVGFFAWAIQRAVANPESPDYETFGLPCRPDLALWDEEGGCTIRVPSEDGIDAVDVRLPPEWIAQAFPGNPELLGVRASGMFAWNPGASSPVQAALVAACPWLPSYESVHFAGYGPYVVPGWGVAPYPAELAWIRLRHAHPWNYNGPQNIAQLVVQVRRLAYFWARDQSTFATWMRDWVVEKRDVEQSWWAVALVGDACHRLGISWEVFSRDHVEGKLGLNPGSQGEDRAAWTLLVHGPQSHWASFDETNHAPPEGLYKNPSRAFEGAWALVVPQ